GPGGLTLSAAVVGPVVGAWLALYCTSCPIFSSSVIRPRRSLTRCSIFASTSCGFDGLTGCRSGACFWAFDRKRAQQTPPNTRANRVTRALHRRRFLEDTRRPVDLRLQSISTVTLEACTDAMDH